MDTTVISALIGAVVALIVAIITAIMTVRGWQEENRRLIKQQQREAKLEHLQRQIEELYGPLWGLVQQSQIIYDVACRVLPSENGKVRQSLFDKNDDRHWKVWRFFTETYFQPLHSQKAELINTKSYLLESGKSSSARPKAGRCIKSKNLYPQELMFVNVDLRWIEIGMLLSIF